MDSGLSGPWWKSLYDSLESYDAPLAVTQTNRYFSRLQLTASIQALNLQGTLKELRSRYSSAQRPVNFVKITDAKREQAPKYTLG